MPYSYLYDTGTRRCLTWAAVARPWPSDSGAELLDKGTQCAPAESTRFYFQSSERSREGAAATPFVRSHFDVVAEREEDKAWVTMEAFERVAYGTAITPSLLAHSAPVYTHLIFSSMEAVVSPKMHIAPQVEVKRDGAGRPWRGTRA